jgi:uncharacterized protein with LGFP repeats
MASVVDMVNGPVAAFWAGQSDGAVRLGVVAAVDTRSRPLAAPCGDYSALWKEAAARAGWTPGRGKHLLVSLPAGAGGCADGLAEIGSSLGSGGRLYVRGAVASVAMHELGHNFGLGHASQTQCDGAVETGTCRVAPYADWYDVMGYSWSSVGTLNAAHAARLGLLPAAERVELGSTSPSRTTTLVPMAQASGTRALRLTDSRGTVYWLEYRQASGQDSWLASSPMGLQSGVTVRRAAGQPNTSLLLDGTPSAEGQWDGDLRTVLPAGRATGLAGGEFTVTVQDVTATGATVRVDTGWGTQVEQRYAATGGAGGSLGGPVSGLVCGLRGGGCFQHFEGGSIYWSAATGARVVTAPVRDRWAALGWEAGRLGYPVGDTRCGLTGGGCYQPFQGGALYSTAATGTRMVVGAIRTRWAAQGWETGALGYPTSDEICGLRGGGCFQTFQGGSVYWSPGNGARVVSGALRTRWGQLGWETGLLGYPLTDSRCGLAGGGCYQLFQGGSLYSSPTTGVRLVGGVIRDRWASLGWEAGSLGYPVADARCGLRAGGCFQAYQRGALYWSPTTGVRVVSGTVRDRWAALGWEAGALGYPLSDTRCGLAGGGCFQLFQGGSLYSSPGTGVRTVKGAIRDRWASLGWEAGALGYPVADEVCGPGGCQQAFQRGWVLWSPATGAYVR